MPKRTLASTGEMVDIERGQMTDAQRKTADVNGARPRMAVKVYAPFQMFYEGEAFSLTAENETGPFDILPKHHNFLCMLVPCELIVHTIDDETKVIKISRALMHVKSEKVTVFVDV